MELHSQLTTDGDNYYNYFSPHHYHYLYLSTLCDLRPVLSWIMVSTFASNYNLLFTPTIKPTEIAIDKVSPSYGFLIEYFISDKVFLPPSASAQSFVFVYLTIVVQVIEGTRALAHGCRPEVESSSDYCVIAISFRPHMCIARSYSTMVRCKKHVARTV